MRLNRLVPVPALTVAAWLAATPVAADTFRVGADGACSHSTLAAALLAAAINGPAQDTIRVARNQTYTGINLPVSGHSLRIEGGYDSCSDTTPSGRTVLSGAAGGNPAISTSGSGPFTLELVDLEIANSPSGGSATRLGGGLRITGNYQVTLRNTRIRDNVAARGGGIYIDAVAGTRLTLALPINAIFGNTASIAGGGLYCRGPAQIDWQRNAGAVYENRADDGGTDPDESGSGGGAALFDGCDMTQHAGSGLSALFANSAAIAGGGYYLRNLARLRLTGDATAPAVVSGNRTDVPISGGPITAGGGIAIRDIPATIIARSVVVADNAWIDDNYAWQGSGVALLTGGEFLMRRTLSAGGCHDARYCSSLSFNGMDGSTMGARAGAVWAANQSVVDISGTYIEGNSAGVGSAFWTNGTARTRLDSVVLSGNFGSSVLIDARDIAGSGGITLAWSTIAGNSYVGGTFGRQILRASGLTGVDRVRVYGSLIGDPLPDAISAASMRSDCVLRDPAVEPLGTGSNYTRQGTLASPYGLVNPAGGDFHLASGNEIPVDWCDASLDARVGRDIAGNLAIVDAARPNLHGIHDLGAQEWPQAQSDLIFANGFQ